MHSHRRSTEFNLAKKNPEGWTFGVFFIIDFKPIKKNNIRRSGLAPSSLGMALRPIQADE